MIGTYHSSLYDNKNEIEGSRGGGHMGVNETIGINHFRSDWIGMDYYCWKSAVMIIIKKVGGVQGDINQHLKESILHNMRTPK